MVYQEELSDTFGEYGDIVSIDQIVPRGCAFIVMHRRQDAHKAMQALKNHKLQGRAITISWAAGKGVKSKEWKDFWDLELGVTYIPWNKLDESTDFDGLEEGGMFDEDSMPSWMKEKIIRMKSIKEKGQDPNSAIGSSQSGLLFGIDTTQPPPGPPGPPGGPPPMLPMVPGQFSMAPPRPLLGPMGMNLSGIPMPPNIVSGIPPPHPLMMPGVMPPGFPPIPSGEKGRDGSGGLGPFMPMGPMGLPPGPGQFPPSLNAGPGVPPPGTGGGNITGDDQMDIEMDEDDVPSAPQMNFNQPPPFFPGAGSGPPGVGVGPPGSADGSQEGRAPPEFSRERRGGPGNSRWGGRSAGAEEELSDGQQPRWHENGKFGGNGGPPPGRGRGGPMSMPPMDMNNPQQRPDFMEGEYIFLLRGK